MKNLQILLLSMLLSSCGLSMFEESHTKHVDGGRQHDTTNAVFTAYVSKYEKYAQDNLNQSGYKVNDIPINFGDTQNSDFDGVCLKYSDGKKEIIIKESWWKGASDEQKEILILHELGHCDLNREHETDRVALDGKAVSVSIMYNEIPASSTYLKLKDEYLKELFMYDKDGVYQKVAALTAEDQKEKEEEESDSSPSVASN